MEDDENLTLPFIDCLRHGTPDITTRLYNENHDLHTAAQMLDVYEYKTHLMNW